MYTFSVSMVVYKPDRVQLLDVVRSLAVAVECLQLQWPGAVVLIVVDNSVDHLGSDREQAVRSVWLQELRFIHSAQNIGFGRGHNQAIEYTDAQYHLILNPDVILQPDALLNGLLFLQQHPQVQVVSPYAVHENQQRQYLCKQYPTVLDLLLRGFAPSFVKLFFSRRLDLYELKGQTEQSELVTVPIVSGCFMLLRRASFIRSGGFSAVFFLYFEDFDLSIRLRQYGELAYVPTVRIMHYGGQAAKKGGRHIFLFVRSMMTFFNLHGWRWF